MDHDELHLSQIQRYDSVFDDMCQSSLSFAELPHPSEPCWMCGRQLRDITTMSEIFFCVLHWRFFRKEEENCQSSGRLQGYGEKGSGLRFCLQTEEKSIA